MAIDEDAIKSEIGALKNLLEQKDYYARKVLYEVCEYLEGQGASLPMFDKYKAVEEEAQGFRARINELEQELQPEE
jgi:hypothetical protein